MRPEGRNEDKGLVAQSPTRCSLKGHTVSNELSTQSASRNVSTWLTPSSFEKATQIAELMMKCGTMPAHLKTIGDCFRVVVQAAKWGMDPFAVGECTSLVHGRMCYEGKLVAAVLDAMGALEGGRLKFKITGKGQDSSIVLTGIRRGETEELTLEGSVKQWRTHTFNKDGKEIPNNWDKNPHDQLVYKGTRQWARIHAPAPLLGVYTRDEMEEVVHEVEHTVVPEAKPAKSRKVDLPEATVAKAQPGDALVAGIVKHEEAKQQSVAQSGATEPKKLTVTDLVTMVTNLHAEFKDASLPGIRKINDRLGIKKTGDCPPEHVEQAVNLVMDLTRELAEGGAQ